MTPLVFEANGINFDTLSQNIGLVNCSAMVSEPGLPKRFIVLYYGKRLRLEMSKDPDNELDIRFLRQELAPICGSKDGFYEYVKNQWWIRTCRKLKILNRKNRERDTPLK